MDFGTRLKTLRRSAGLTQAQLGERVGLTKSVVSFYELRERAPSPETLVKFVSVFRVSTDYLLGVEPRRSIDVSDLSNEQIEIIETIVAAFRNKRADQ